MTLNRIGFILFVLLLTSCQRIPIRFVECGPELATINIIDQNGVSETISNDDRLAQYADVDFLMPQPYRKVMRVYKRNEEGNILACITSYYSNGQIQQCLDIVNGRACGSYRAWHENGSPKIEAEVLGGDADLTTGAEQTWLFEGSAKAWDEQGNLEAEFCYEKGKLQGDSFYYHSNGSIWKRIPIKDGVKNGSEEIYRDNGILLQTTSYSQDEKDGPTKRYWDGIGIAADEYYSHGKLMQGIYFDISGEKLTDICDGTGIKSIFGRDCVNELHEYRDGIPEGCVQLLDCQGRCYKLYHTKNGLKDGEEVEYFSGTTQPQLSIQWSEGRIHGVSKTFYRDGKMQSQREMAVNKKNGILTAWYADGNIMMIEEYDHDRLVKGEYYKRGDLFPVSTVFDGKGTVTSYDSEGVFLRRIPYRNGRPEI